MPRTLHVVVGLVIMAVAVVVAWCGANISADFADLGSVTQQHGDDGTVPGVLVLACGAVLFALGIVVTSLPLQRRR